MTGGEWVVVVLVAVMVGGICWVFQRGE